MNQINQMANLDVLAHVKSAKKIKIAINVVAMIALAKIATVQTNN
jgi:hypothetical protein